MTRTYDIVIVGAGIVGMAAGERLASAGKGKVLVVEKEPMPATGSTGKSAGGIRQQFNDPFKIRAARFGFGVYDAFPEQYGIDPAFRKHGYLILHSQESGARALEQGVRVQQDLGLKSVYLNPNQVREMIPALNVTDVRGASFNATDGYLDPHAVVQGFQQAFRNAGGEIAFMERAVGLVRESGRTVGLRTDKGEIAAPVVVLAPGPHVKVLLAALGLALPLRTCRRQIFSTGPVPGVDSHWPLILDVDAPFYFRPEGDGVILSLAETDEMDPPATGHEIPLNRQDLPLLAQRASHRCPPLTDARIRNGWAGIRTLTPDERPVLGPVPGVPGLYLAAGFSGHGITLAPFAAEFLVREIMGPVRRQSERAPFLPDRFLAE